MMYRGVTSVKPLVVLFASILLQTISCMVHGQDNFVQDRFQHIALYDVNGHPIGNDAMETKGSPFFVAKWKLGWFSLADGRFFAGVPVRLDQEKQIVHYRRADGSDFDMPPGLVKEVVMLDTVAGVSVTYRFVSGFQPIDNQSGINFYLLLDSGKVSFLESTRKIYKESKDDFSGEKHMEYSVYTDFYVFSAGKMERIKRDPKYFLGLTKDKQDQMNDYLEKNKVSFRSIEDIRQFVHYYNGLP
jgi:hypothetical protein